MTQVILTIVFYVWLFGVLGLLGVIWHTSATHTHRMEQTLVDVAMRSALAAQKAADAAYLLAAGEKSH